MSFNKISFSLLLLLSGTCFSQDKETTDITDIPKVTFLSPGFSYEKRVGKFQSFHAYAFMTTSFSASLSSSQGSNISIYFSPALSLQYRHYYNAARLKEKGRRTEMNSLNYVCLFLQTVFSRASISSSYFSEENRRAINTIAIAWGLQRNLPKRFSVDLTVGPGYLFAKSTTQDNGGQLITKNAGHFTLAVQFSLGLWLNKRN